MPAEPDNLVLELLRAMRGDMAEMRTEQREQRGRLAAIDRSLSHLERGLAHVGSEVAELRAEFGARFDRVLDRMERIERRLDLRDA